MYIPHFRVQYIQYLRNVAGLVGSSGFGALYVYLFIIYCQPLEKMDYKGRT